MHIRWLTAFVDLSGPAFEPGAAFWRDVTHTEFSAPRGPTGQFATLVPAEGDAYLRVQRVDDDAGAGVHLDLHVESIDEGARRAMALGAEVVDAPGHVIMRSPAGYVFCFVEHNGESTVPAPTATPAPHRVDQVTIDVSPDRFDAECAFWRDVTGWELADSVLSEFRSLDRPAGIPIRLLLQRRDEAPAGADASAHLDIACGDDPDAMEAIAASHVELGATRLGPTKRWIRMLDPVGNAYCITPRTP